MGTIGAEDDQVETPYGSKGSSSDLRDPRLSLHISIIKGRAPGLVGFSGVPSWCKASWTCLGTRI